VNFTASVYPDAKGKVLYTFDDAQLLRAFAVDKKTAALTQLTDSPWETMVGGDVLSAGVLVTKKFAYAISRDANDAWQPFTVGKKGALQETGIAGDTPIAAETFTADTKGKRIVFAGDDGIAVFTIGDKKQGELTQLDSEGFTDVLEGVNAVVMVTR
jgi:hypothetical protein